jgi:hypothetical protein
MQQLSVAVLLQRENADAAPQACRMGLKSRLITMNWRGGDDSPLGRIARRMRYMVAPEL